MDQHFHPIVYSRLRQIFAAEDWQGLMTYLDSLSNSHFRTAGYLIGERLLAEVDAKTFWTVVIRLIMWNPKAFTVTMAKAATKRLKEGALTLQDEGFRELARTLQAPERVIDREKLLLQWLPVMTKPEAIEELFEALGVSEPRRRVEFLLRTDSLAAGFVLLRTLRFEEYDREYLTSVCRQLMRRASTLSHTTGHADGLSFNLASLLRAYFDLDELRGTFSLALQPYELSRLDTDFDVFRRGVTKV